MDSYLDLPELPNDVNEYSWQIPSKPNYEWINYEAAFDSFDPKATTQVNYFTLFYLFCS